MRAWPAPSQSLGCMPSERERTLGRIGPLLFASFGQNAIRQPSFVSHQVLSVTSLARKSSLPPGAGRRGQTRLVYLASRGKPRQEAYTQLDIHFRWRAFALSCTRVAVTQRSARQTQGGIVGNPFVHLELNTTDLNKAKDFYGKLFSWKLEDMPMGGGGTYTMINVGEGTGGGMMKHPMPGAPSAWLAYVMVDDVAASTKKAKSLGATIIKDVSEVPQYGWFSILQDPTGAVFALWKPMKK